jgi:thymidylate synthase ThyX
VRFDEKVKGRYKYFRDPDIAASKHAALYEETNDRLFSTYAAMIDPMIAWVQEKFPQEADESDRAYTAATKAKALDALRGLLPAATLTNVGLYGNGRAFEYLMTKMYASGLTEMRELADSMHRELSTVIPSLVARSNDEKYGQATIAYLRGSARAIEEFAAAELGDIAPEAATGPTVELIDYDANAEERAIAATLYGRTELSSKQLRDAVANLSQEKRAELIKALADARGNRRHRPGRGFENTSYEFDFAVNYGAYRDLQRHRMLSQDRQRLSVLHGYDVPPQIVEAGFETQFRVAMDQAALAYKKIVEDFPEQAQYVVPFGYRLRYRMNLSLRELYHLVELRSTPQGHPDYRYVAQQMYLRVKEVHPLLVEAMKFVDMSDADELERRASEKRTDQKLANLESRK